MIIWLNGPSSSGKTTLALELQKQLSVNYLHFELDKFIAMLPERIQEDRLALEKNLPTLISLFHKNIHEFSKQGFSLIVDHVFEQESWFLECAELMINTDILYVGLTADLGTLKKREINRGNRSIGLSEWHLGRVHNYSNYDIFIDSSKIKLSEQISIIKNHLSSSCLGLRRYE